MLPSNPSARTAVSGGKPARIRPGANTAAAAPAAPCTKRRPMSSSSDPACPQPAEAAA
jgi:hypothetical protein